MEKNPEGAKQEYEKPGLVDMKRKSAAGNCMDGSADAQLCWTGAGAWECYAGDGATSDCTAGTGAPAYCLAGTGN